MRRRIVDLKPFSEEISTGPNKDSFYTIEESLSGTTVISPEKGEPEWGKLSKAEKKETKLLPTGGWMLTGAFGYYRDQIITWRVKNPELGLVLYKLNIIPNPPWVQGMERLKKELAGKGISLTKDDLKIALSKVLRKDPVTQTEGVFLKALKVPGVFVIKERTKKAMAEGEYYHKDKGWY